MDFNVISQVHLRGPRTHSVIWVSWLQHEEEIWEWSLKLKYAITSPMLPFARLLLSLLWIWYCHFLVIQHLVLTEDWKPNFLPGFTFLQSWLTTSHCADYYYVTSLLVVLGLNATLKLMHPSSSSSSSFLEWFTCSISIVLIDGYLAAIHDEEEMSCVEDECRTNHSAIEDQLLVSFCFIHHQML